MVRQRILELDSKGEPVGIIAARTGASSETVRRILRKAGRLATSMGRPRDVG